MSRVPDFVLKGLNKQTDQRSGRLGAAWKNQDGSVSLVIDPWVKLEHSDAWVFTLFPYERPGGEEPATPAPAGAKR